MCAAKKKYMKSTADKAKAYRILTSKFDYVVGGGVGKRCFCFPDVVALRYCLLYFSDSKRRISLIMSVVFLIWA